MKRTATPVDESRSLDGENHKPRLQTAIVTQREADAQDTAGNYRRAGYSARVYLRSVHAAGVRVPVWVVVVRAKKGTRS